MRFLFCYSVYKTCPLHLKKKRNAFELPNPSEQVIRSSEMTADSEGKCIPEPKYRILKFRKQQTYSFPDFSFSQMTNKASAYR